MSVEDKMVVLSYMERPLLLFPRISSPTFFSLWEGPHPHTNSCSFCGADSNLNSRQEHMMLRLSAPHSFWVTGGRMAAQPKSIQQTRGFLEETFSLYLLVLRLEWFQRLGLLPSSCCHVKSESEIPEETTEI